MAERGFDVSPAEMQHLVETLGAIGEQPGGGIIRHVYDPAWVAARAQLAEWMREAGLTVRETPSAICSGVWKATVRDGADRVAL